MIYLKPIQLCAIMELIVTLAVCENKPQARLGDFTKEKIYRKMEVNHLTTNSKLTQTGDDDKLNYIISKKYLNTRNKVWFRNTKTFFLEDRHHHTGSSQNFCKKRFFKKNFNSRYATSNLRIQRAAEENRNNTDQIKRNEKKINSNTLSSENVRSSLLEGKYHYRDSSHDNYKRRLFNNTQSNLSSPITLSSRIIDTRYGKLQGMLVNIENGSSSYPMEVFLGVPYATPPVGSSRFSPTRTPTPWEGIRTSDHFEAVCPQKFPEINEDKVALTKMPKLRLEELKKIQPFLQNQSEDCLYLNIFTPHPDAALEASKTNYPVIVYIHGESFEWGTGNVYDGTVLSSNTKTVVVTLNYRLGLLGFLNANPVPQQKPRVANYGLMDQIAALHWLQQNIALFGGNPSNVTLIGHGSGAACVNFLMISPTVVPGLFHRTILLSGSALSSWALVENPVHYSLILAKSLNCTIPEDVAKNHETIVDCLRSVPLEQLVSVEYACPKFLSAFGPSVDGVVINKDYTNAFITKSEEYSHPYVNNRGESMKGAFTIKSFSNTYDVMFGVLPNEADSILSEDDVKHGIDVERRDRIFRTYVRNSYTNHLNEIFYTMANEYTDWGKNSQSPLHIRDLTLEALTDAQYVAPAIQMADFIANFDGATDDESPRKSKLFFYVFDYSADDADGNQKRSPVHGEELQYLFGAPLVGGFSHFERNYSSSQVAFARTFQRFIGNFVRYGNPNGELPVALPNSNNNENDEDYLLTVAPRVAGWEEYDPTHQKYMEIGQQYKMKSHYKAHKSSVWLRLIPELHRSGADDAESGHNLFRNHDDTNLYDGVVRIDPYNRTSSVNSYNITYPQNMEISTEQTEISTCLTIINSSNITNDDIERYNLENNAAYSTALSVTIAIGCTLLIINVLIFAGVYYQRDKKIDKTKCCNRTKYNDSQMYSHTQSKCHSSPLRSIDRERKDKGMNKIQFEGPVSCKIEMKNQHLSSNTYCDETLAAKRARQVSTFQIPPIYCEDQTSSSKSFTLPRNLGQHMCQTLAEPTVYLPSSILCTPPHKKRIGCDKNNLFFEMSP